MGFDRTYEGLKLAGPGGYQVVALGGFDRTYEGLKPRPHARGLPGHGVLTVPMRV